MIKECWYCKQHFETKYKKTKYCSKDCSSKGRSVIYMCTDEEFQEKVERSKSIRELLMEINPSQNSPGRTYYTAQKRIKELNLSTSHFLSLSELGSIKRTTIPLEDILVENSTYGSISILKNRLLKQNLLDYKCSICSNTGEWNNKKLMLQLDHINGKNNDHRLENLRLLCPNCHSQTETFTSKNKTNNKPIEK